MAPAREFGDHMSTEGATSHIPKILLLMYGVIMAYAWLVATVTGCSFWTVPCYYAGGMVAFYIWHLMAHSKWTGEMNRLHMKHHLKSFPPKAFYGTDPDAILKQTGLACPTFMQLVNPLRGQSLGRGEFMHEAPLYVFLFLILGVGRFVVGDSVGTLLFMLVGYIVMGLVGNALHVSFHVRDFELEKYEWYLELRSLHYIHHLGDMHSNLGMLNLGIDGIFGSLAVVDPVAAKQARVVDRAARKQQGASGVDLHAPEGGVQGNVATVDDKELAKLGGGLSRHRMQRAVGSAAGLVAASLGFDLPLDAKKVQGSAHQRGWATVLSRLVFIVIAFAAYEAAENALLAHDSFNLAGGLLGPDPVEHARAPSAPVAVRGFVGACVADRGHALLEPVRAWLLQDPELLRGACAASQYLSETGIATCALAALFGDSVRPVLSIAITFGLRSFIRSTTTTMDTAESPLPLVGEGAAKGCGNIWDDSAVAVNVFVQPHGHNSAQFAFFSGAVALAVVLAVELTRLAPAGNATFLLSTGPKGRAAVLGALFVAATIVLVLATRASWSFDVVCAVLVARYATVASRTLAPFLDALLP